MLGGVYCLWYFGNFRIGYEWFFFIDINGSVYG